MIRWLLPALLLACSTLDHAVPVRGTAYRIGDETLAEGGELTVDILKSGIECAQVDVNPMVETSCPPFVDRATGEARLSFVVKDPQSSIVLRRSIDPKDLVLSHDLRSQDDVTLIPHDPVTGGQLFIVLIDGSGSMYENDGARIKKVYEALMYPDVVKGFFPGGEGKTGVLLARFTDRLRGLDGGPMRIVTNPRDYKALVQGHLLDRSGGYTHLYGAIRSAYKDLLSSPSIKRFLTDNQARPTIVALTDGYNNEAASDTCRDNVARLDETLTVIREVREARRGEFEPVLFTAGLGRERAGAGDLKKRRDKALTAKTLCGRYADNRIDDPRPGMGLEDSGIDHVSLWYLAEAGGGSTFVKRQPKGLAEVFAAASAKRHRWFEVHYKVPSSVYHRRQFTTRIDVSSYERAFTDVTFFPNPWIDGPSAAVNEQTGFAEPTGHGRSLGFLLSILGLLLTLSVVGAALFNARRAVFRRAPRK